MEAVYRFKQKLCYLLLEKGLNQNKCRELAPKLLRMIAELRQQGLEQMVQLGNTLHSWREEIATMCRFTRNNGITEGFHTKMDVLQLLAYGSETSTITGSGLRYCVLRSVGGKLAPIKCVEPICM